MNYYIDLFSPETARAFALSDRKISGFRPSQKTYVENRGIKKGDKFICYLIKLQRFIGVLEVQDSYFENDDPIFVKKNDPFTLRFKVKVIVWLSPEYSIPISANEIWNHLSFTKGLAEHSKRWTNKVFASPRLWPKKDGAFLERKLIEQSRLMKKYDLSIKEGLAFQDMVANMLKLSGFQLIKNNLFKKGPDIIVEDPVSRARLVFQCKFTSNKERRVYPNLESLINEYSTVARENKADRGVIVIGGGYTLSPKLNLETFKKDLQRKKIVIWSSGIVTSYKKLANMIGPFAKYQIFSDMGLNYKFGRKIKVPAFKVEQNFETDKEGVQTPRISFIVTKIQPDWLIKAASVHRRIDRGGYTSGYQRILEPVRIKSVSAYLAKEEWVLPNSIILCTNKNVLRSKDLKIKKNGLLELPSKVGSFWIMDGQHRLFGFSKIEDSLDRKSHLISVIFDSEKMGMNYEEQQANIFVDINYKAKKVNTALLLELMDEYKLMNIEKNIGLNVVSFLSKNEIFKRLISGYSDKGGLINLTTFVSSVKSLCSSNGPIASYIKSRNTDDIEKEASNLLLRYFKIIKSEFTEQWGNSAYSLTSDKGIRGLIKLYGRILENFKEKNINDYIISIIQALKKSGFDFHYHAFKGEYIGGQGADQLLEDMAAYIARIVPSFTHDSEILKTKLPKEENQVTEFKSTLRWNLMSSRVDKQMESECLETICAFTNSDGGTLYIGLNDQGTLIGLKEDFKTLRKQNRDGFLIHLNNCIKERLNSAVFSKVSMDVLQDDTSGEYYCAVRVQKSSEPVYLDGRRFLVRLVITSRELFGPEIQEYRNSRG